MHLGGILFPHIGGNHRWEIKEVGFVGTQLEWKRNRDIQEENRTKKEKRHWDKSYQLNVSTVDFFSSSVTLVCISDGQLIH